jgi:predicted PurR-regulated permease PerM
MPPSEPSGGPPSERNEARATESAREKNIAKEAVQASEIDQLRVAAKTRERRAFTLLALVALVAIVRLAMPCGIGLFLGALLAFTSEPLYGALRRRRMNAGPAALLCSIGATIVVTSAVVGMTTLIITRGLLLIGVLRTQLAPGGPLRGMVEQASSRLTSLHVNVADMTQRLENEAVSFGSGAAAFAAELAGATFSGLLTLFFMALAQYFVLRHWTELVSRTERLLPFEVRHTHGLLEQFRVVGREVFLGTVVTGLVQGLFAGFGFFITGVPEAAFFGAVTAVASLIPGIGTLLVWIPIGVILIASGHPGRGLVELVYSALTVGIASDYLIRPRLVGREKTVPSVLMFVALFGGVEVYGIIGLIIGPMIVTLSIAVLKIYEKEVSDRRTSEGRTSDADRRSLDGRTSDIDRRSLDPRTSDSGRATNP